MGKDKVLHLIVGAIIALAGSFLAGWIPGLLLAVVAGGFKEFWDSKGHGQVELMDFIATAIGGIGGVCIWSIMLRLIY